MAKKVIFVGGTAYSGSTFFHMILANDAKGFACGEIRFLLHPHRLDDVDQINNVSEETRKIWYAIRKNGSDNTYETIFNIFPEVEFIVDSSKNPIWIHSQMSHLQKKGIEAKNILIWKTPLEFASSKRKRSRLRGWDQAWLTYHQLYNSLITEWKSVKYKELTKNKALLQQICHFLEIPFFLGKENYWEKEYHSFGGSYTARFHLYEKETAQKHLDKTFDNSRIDKYRKISYSPVDTQSLEQMVHNQIESIPKFKSILALLEARDISNSPDQDNSLPAVTGLRGYHTITHNSPQCCAGPRVQARNRGCVEGRSRAFSGRENHHAFG
jgi:hypothetical protein